MEKPDLLRLVSQLVKCVRCMSTRSSELSRITVPYQTADNAAKVKRQKTMLMQQKQSRQRYRTPVVISCKRKEFNHHRGQTYSEFDPRVLATYGWKHAKSVGDHFTLVPYAENPALAKDPDVPNFSDFGLHDELLNAVEDLGFSEPTHIQSLTIPKILEKEHVVCAAETGSGKTLAFLLPALELVHRQKVFSKFEPLYNSPRTLILTPSRELADQIMDVCQQLCSKSQINIHSLCGGRGTQGRMRWLRSEEMDILISTPGVLKKFQDRNLIQSSHLQHVILDEADSLLDDSFSSLINLILQRLQVTAKSENLLNSGQVGTLFTLVSATMPRSLGETIGEVVDIDTVKKITTRHLHHLMPHVPQTFLRMKALEKTETIVKLVKQNHNQQIPTVVFCNKSSTCFYVMEILKASGIHAVLMNGVMPEKRRSSLYKRFKEGRSDIMVATDIASRGLDLLWVQHVINYDFPDFMSDYIHRAGRVGRVGSQGKSHVTSFISHPWEVAKLWNIEIAARKQEALYNVNANIKRKLSGIITKKFPRKRQNIVDAGSASLANTE